jgi:uncharacterized protein DUF4153
MWKMQEVRSLPRSTIDLDTIRPADAFVVAAALLAALGMDLAVRSGVAGLSGALLVAIVAATMLKSGRVTNPQAQALVAAAPLFGLWLLVRTSPWLIPLDIVAAGCLLALGASLATGGSVLDLTVPQVIRRGLHAAIHGALGLPFVAAPLQRMRSRVDPRATRRGGAVIRGLALAAPLLVILGLLLASADAVFAGFFRLDVNLDPVSLAAHAAALLIGGWGMAGLLRVASARPLAPIPAVPWRLGGVETMIVLGSLCALFGAFAGAQVVALSAGGRHVIETAGLTYAEYGRTGFFQLLAAAAITLVSLMALRAVAAVERPAAGRWFRGLSLAAIALTEVIVIVAVRRLDLYERVFGLTMLRLYSKTFAVWIGVVFALLSLSVAGVAARRRWFLSAAAATGLALLLALDMVNPEAVVVRHNVAHAERSGRFDPAYLAELSDDAVPTLVGALPRLDQAARADVVSRLCPPQPDPWKGWAAYNDARREARRSLISLCGSP